MKKAIQMSKRLVVGVDVSPQKNRNDPSVVSNILRLAHLLKRAEVVLKVGPALRFAGYQLITMIHDIGLDVFADLKLYDTQKTLSMDGELLQLFKPEIVTVSVMAGVKGMKALKAELPKTEILGVTVLTTLTNEDTRAMFTCSTWNAVQRLSKLVAEAGLGGFISSPAEVTLLKKKYGVLMSTSTPAVRPKWTLVKGDDQNPKRIMTPAQAIQAGADRIIMRRPIIQAKNPYDAAMRTIDEMQEALES